MKKEIEQEPGPNALLDEAWRVSRLRHGYTVSFHVPGMFVIDGRRGKYHAVSITGSHCDLGCEHCKGTLLKTMAQAGDPRALMDFGLSAWSRGAQGLLVTGGCDRDGRLPWADFLPIIERLKIITGLTITVHSGQVDLATARALKEAGVDQALVDVIGDDATARGILHLNDGVAGIRRTMENLVKAELEIVPHIIFGIDHGREKGEHDALAILKGFRLRKYVVVVLMPTRGTPMAGVEPPTPESVARFIAKARLELPDSEASLGCARPRGRYRRQLDVLALRAGVNSMAIPSDTAVDEAETLGLQVVFVETCCSLGYLE